MQYGTAEQKEFFLPRILAGECHFAIGYSEPEAGTDLAVAAHHGGAATATTTSSTARRSSPAGAHYAQYIWLAARTDPEAKKHKGITMMIARHADPGYSWTPIITMDGAPPHQLHLLHRRARAGGHGGRRGEQGLGPDRQPAQPRAGHARPGRQPRPDLRPVPRLGPPHGAGRTSPTYAGRSAAVYACFRTNELLNWQVAADMDLGWLGAPDASATKVYGSERMQEVGRLVGDVLARYGDPADPETAELMERRRPRGQGRARADLRRRRQRGPAGADRHARPEPAEAAPMSHATPTADAGQATGTDRDLHELAVEQAALGRGPRRRRGGPGERPDDPALARRDRRHQPGLRPRRRPGSPLRR